MKIEKIETVNFYDNEGKNIKVGDLVIFYFQNGHPDVAGEFAGLNNRNMVGVTCSNGEHWFKQSSIEDIVVYA